MPTLTRSQLLALVHAALGYPDAWLHAQDLALAWLRLYPGDLQVQAAYARLLLQRQQAEAALPIVSRLCAQHPLDARLHLLWVQAARRQAPSAAGLANTCLLGLGKSPLADVPVAPWGHTLAALHAALSQDDLPTAERHLTDLLSASPDTPLLAIAHLQVLAARFPQDAQTALPPVPPVYALLETYRTRWPACLPLLLWQAELYLTNGQEALAMNLLHRVVVRDAGGDVARDLWGPEHRYRALWPRELTMPLQTSLPLRLTSLLGWNGLPEGKTGTDDPARGAVSHGVQAPPERASVPHASPWGRWPFGWREKSPKRPLYLVISHKNGLIEQYGASGAQRVWQALEELRDVLWVRYDRQAALLAVDDAESMAQFGLEPVSVVTPWNVKLALHEVQAALETRGQRIGALLLVGGDGILPFHRLSNPLDDDDPDVPSDAPYGCADENYFVGQWPVGRLPGDATRRVEVLLVQIAQVTARQGIAPGGRTRWACAMDFLRRAWQWLWKDEPLSAMGYTAQVWWPAALEVFQPLGDAGDVLASPPVARRDFVGSGLYPARLAYFNLHGRKDDPAWFGQCDPRQMCEEMYPLALHPQDVGRFEYAPRVVFSEACYGAHLEERAREESVTLQFLAHGTEAVVASTVLAYGSLNRKLLGADLLGKLFWQRIRHGVPAGEALRQARLAMVAHYGGESTALAAEDQKTLISFVLYGDPMAQVRPFAYLPKNGGQEQRMVSPVGWVDGDEAPGSLSPQAEAQVRHIVAKYLPGMQDARMRVRRGRIPSQAKGPGAPLPGHKVVILQKSGQFVRLTLDKEDRLVRLAASRSAKCEMRNAKCDMRYAICEM